MLLPEEALDDAGREVPLTDVVALEETPVLVLVLDNTVALELDVEEGESADVELTLDAFDAVLALPEASADVDDADGMAVEDAVSSAFPELEDAPAPAPEDEPAVFDAMAAGALLIEVD